MFNTIEQLEEAYLPIIQQTIGEFAGELSEEEINEESYERFKLKYGIDFNEEYDRLEDEV